LNFIVRLPNYPPRKWFNLFLQFTWQEAASCFFAVYILAALVITRYYPLPILPRYDYMLLFVVFMQVAMVWLFKMETVDELKVICLFHILGTTMEIFKVQMGSWSYPGEAYSKIMGVPLYSGFMYASVASYITQAWLRLNIQVENFPATWVNVVVGNLIYFNFFTHHYTYDIRYLLLPAVLFIYWRTRVHFKLAGEPFVMPVVLAFLLTGFFIWLAENIATFHGAWQYPNQAHNWKLVHPGKVNAWLLLFIVSFLIVAQLKRIKASKTGYDDFI
jgi:uncharacterized membrane protein YoaT (DUF817 family)